MHAIRLTCIIFSAGVAYVPLNAMSASKNLCVVVCVVELRGGGGDVCLGGTLTVVLCWTG